MLSSRTACISLSRELSLDQAQREEAATARSRLRAEMDEALAAQQRRAEAWQAELDAKDARLTTLDAKLQARSARPACKTLAESALLLTTW